MQMSDVIGDMIARIRNGQMAKKPMVVAPYSKLREAVLAVLKEEGYINGFQKKEISKGISEIEISLKYYEGEGAIKEIKRVSKPGRRVYTKSEDIKAVYNGLGVIIVSTSQGVIADHKAKEMNLGGEIICTVF